MADNLERHITSVIQQVAQQVRDNMAAKGINASGRTSASIRVVAGDGHIQLIVGKDGTHQIDAPIPVQGSDTAPAPTLEIGREGGDVPRGFYYIIREWALEKHLSFSSDQNLNTFAYFTSRKIAREGTRRSKQPVDVYSDEVAAAVTSIRQACSQYLRETIIKAQTNF